MADEEEFVFLTKIRDYFRIDHRTGKKIEVHAHDDHRAMGHHGLPQISDASAHRAVGLHQAQSHAHERAADQRRQDYVPRRAAREHPEAPHSHTPSTHPAHTPKHATPHELEGANHTPIDHNVPQHHKDAAARMSDSAVIAAAAKIRMKDEQEWTPLDRAIFAQVRHRGLKLHAKFSNVSLTNTSFDAWWTR